MMANLVNIMGESFDFNSLVNDQTTPFQKLVNNGPVTFDSKKLLNLPVQRERPDYRERFGDDSSQSTRVFDVPWFQRNYWRGQTLGYSLLTQKQVLDVFGFPTGDVIPNSTYLSRVLPQQHPEQPWLYAIDADLLEGVGIPGLNFNTGMIAFYRVEPAFAEGYARFAVTHRALDYDVLSDATVNGDELRRYVSRFETYAAENLTLNGSQYKFLGTTQSIQVNPVKLFPTKELTYLWHEVPIVPEKAIKACIGKVNSVAFDANSPTLRAAGIYTGYDPETLLFLAPSWKRYYTKVGTLAYDVSYKFLYRPKDPNTGAGGWNQFFRGSTFGFQLITSDGTTGGKRVYDKADFAQLFQIDPTLPVTPP